MTKLCFIYISERTYQVWHMAFRNWRMSPKAWNPSSHRLSSILKLTDGLPLFSFGHQVPDALRDGTLAPWNVQHQVGGHDKSFFSIPTDGTQPPLKSSLAAFGHKPDKLFTFWIFLLGNGVHPSHTLPSRTPASIRKIFSRAIWLLQIQSGRWHQGDSPFYTPPSPPPLRCFLKITLKADALAYISGHFFILKIWRKFNFQ